MTGHVGEYSQVYGGTDRHMGEHSVTGHTLRQLKKYLKSEGTFLGRRRSIP